MYFNVPLALLLHGIRVDTGLKFHFEFPKSVEMTQPNDRRSQQNGDEGDFQSFGDHEGFECIQVSIACCYNLLVAL